MAGKIGRFLVLSSTALVMDVPAVKEVSSVANSNGAIGGLKKRRRVAKEHFYQPPLLKAIFTYISYGIIILLGHIHDFLRKLGLKKAGSMDTKNVSAAWRYQRH